MKADKKGLNLTDREISQDCHCHLQTVYNTRKWFVESRLEYTLGRKPRSNSPITPIIDGEKEAHLIAISCQTPPEGYFKWSCRLIAEKMVQLEIVDSISRQTVSRALKKKKT